MIKQQEKSENIDFLGSLPKDEKLLRRIGFEQITRDIERLEEGLELEEHSVTRPGRLWLGKHGATLSIPLYGGTIRGKRGFAKFWSPGVQSAHKKSLMSFDYSAMADTGVIFAFTGTLGRSPDAEDFTKIRKSFISKVRGLGGAVWWNAELTKLGRLHLHAMVYFPSGALGGEFSIRRCWLSAARACGYRVNSGAQHTSTLRDNDGWLKYLSKHIEKSSNNYQRLLPVGWQGGMNVRGIGDEFRKYLVSSVHEVPAKLYPLFRRQFRNAIICKHRSSFYLPARVKQVAGHIAAVVDKHRRVHIRGTRRIKKGGDFRRRGKIKSIICPVMGWVSREVAMRIWMSMLEKEAWSIA